MKKLIVFSVFFGFLFLPVFVFASEWRVFAPSFGKIVFGELRAEIISSPFGRRDGVCDGAEETDKKCEAIFLRQWLRAIPANQPRAIFIVGEVLAPTAFVRDYSFLISSRGGVLQAAGGRNIRFSYYTVNADAAEAVSIEKHRSWLNEMTRTKKKIRLSGKISRIETSDLTLFEKGKTATEFLDFYLSDIQFEK